MANFKIFPVKFGLPILMILIAFNGKVNAQEDYDSSLMTRAQADDILQEMLYADSRSSMQVNSILRQLKQLMLDKSGEEDYQGLEEDSSELASAEKRAIRALMRGNGKPDLGGKRSIGILAKNGQLPSKEPESEISASPSWMDTEKRNVASILRSGIKSGKRSVSSVVRQYQLPNMYGKRNYAALMRSGMIPSAYHSKRNLAALARANSYQGKRNVGALARDWVLPKTTQKYDVMDKDAEKRNIQSLKNSINGGRKKRELSESELEDLSGEDEYADPLVQTAPVDYEELYDIVNQAYPLQIHSDDKRFLGSLARTGFYNTHPSYEKRHIGTLARSMSGSLHSSSFAPPQQEKRHLAAFARSGWVPSFRPTRGFGGFSREGRARSAEIDGFFSPLQELRKPIPIAAGCKRCDNDFANSIYNNNWLGLGFSSGSAGIGTTPPRVTAFHWRNFREPTTSFRKW